MTGLIVVGLGRQGQRHVRAAASAGFEMVATVDPMAQGLGGDALHAKTVQEALAAKPGAAIVAAPSELHADLAIALLEAGVPVLVEKPLAATSAEATRVVETAHATGTPLATGHVERFNPAVQLVHAMLHQGKLGHPIAFSFRRVGLPPPNPIHLSVVHDLAVHDVDVFALLAGPPVLVGANGWPAEGAVESAHLLLRAGVTQGLVEVNWRTPVRLRHFTVTTEQVYVEVNYTTQRVEVVEASDPEEFVDFAAFQSHYGSARRVQLEGRAAEPLVEQLRAFHALVRGEPDPFLATGEDGRRAIEIAEAAVASIRHA